MPTTTYTNLVTNPQPTTATSWGQNSGTGGATTGSLITAAAGPAGNNARRATFDTGTTAPSGGVIQGTTTTGAPVSASTAYSAGGYVRSSVQQRVVCRIQWVSAAGTLVGTVTGTEVVVAANTWTEVKIENMTSTSDSAFARLNWFATPGTSAVNWAAGNTIDVQAATVVAGAVFPQPFHGGMTDDATHDYAWTGTADASTSTLAITTTATLDPPAGITATAVSSTQIDLAWTNDDIATAVDIERNGTVIVVGHAGTSYSDTGLSPSTTYTYRWRSVGS